MTGTPARRIVSVIIPCYNRAHCVGEAIDSVLAQDPPPDEVIVIDDGSTDATAAVLAGYGDRIIALHRENAGAGAARNAGLAQARGDWIAFLDSDDIWYPGRLALLQRDLAVAPDIVLHVADLRMSGEGYDRGFFDLRGWPVAAGEAEYVADPFARALSGLSLIAAAVRADTARASGGFPAELEVSEDTAFFSAVALGGPALFSRTTVAEARRLPGDETGLVQLFGSDPVRAYGYRQHRFELLLSLPMNAEKRRLVRRHASGHLFKLAQAEADAGISTHRQTLLRMTKTHPKPHIAWLKALPPLVFGRLGYKLVPQKKARFTRVRTAP